MSELGLDGVLIEKGKKPGEPSIVTINCADKTGLGCDICRTILEFGLYITKADISTDGIWCYVVLWVVPHYRSTTIRCSSLKNRLLSVCPSSSLVAVYLNQQPTASSSSPVYLLKLICLDRKGLLHDVTQVLCELDLAIQRVKVTTTPDGTVLDLFFMKDNMELLHTKNRQDELFGQINAVLGETCASCELQLISPGHDFHQGISALSVVVAEELFRSELSDKEIRSQALSPDMAKLKKTSVTLDNSLSPAHTLLQIHCIDHKGLLYDILRTLKDCSIKIAFSRFSLNVQGYRDVDLFIQQEGGKKILHPEEQNTLCSRLKIEMLHPLRVIMSNRGPDAELLVANPVESSGRGRPRVFYDVTLALKTLGICIFLAEIGRQSTSGGEWEVYRFVLDEKCRFELSNKAARHNIVDKVRRTLMGW